VAEGWRPLPTPLFVHSCRSDEASAGVCFPLPRPVRGHELGCPVSGVHLPLSRRLTTGSSWDSAVGLLHKSNICTESIVPASISTSTEPFVANTEHLSRHAARVRYAWFALTLGPKALRPLSASTCRWSDSAQWPLWPLCEASTAIMCRSKLCAVPAPIPGGSWAQVGSYFT
jgi:hypothetical protein